MKLNNNQKILLGLAIGGGIAWWLSRNKKTTTNSASTSSDIKPENLTREEKIDFILENVDSTPSEEKSGFSGDRFEFNPRLGYMMPVGQVDETYAGNEMIVPKEGNLANDLFFNAEGEETDNPVLEAESILNSLTDQELNIVFKIAKARRKNPSISDEKLTEIARLKKDEKISFKEFLKNKINDIKAMKKHPNWKRGMRKEFRKYKKSLSNLDNDQMNERNQRKQKEFNKYLWWKKNRNSFVNQVTNREAKAKRRTI